MTFQAFLRGPAVAALALSLIAPAAAQAAAAAAVVRGLPLPAAAQVPYPASDWKKLDPANLLVIDTTKGRIVVELRPEIAPEHVARMKELAAQHYYDGLKFFRVIDEFMAQTGDKANTGAGDSGLPTLKANFNFRRGPGLPFVGAKNPRGGTFGFIGGQPILSQPDDLGALTADGKVKAWGVFCYGVAGMARTDVEDSASTQFFLMRQDFQTLDDKYTPWGRVVVGLDVVRAIAPGEPPANPDAMTQVRLATDLPAADRPNVWRVDPASAIFQSRMAAVAASRGPDFTPCDLEVPSELRK